MRVLPNPPILEKVIYPTLRNIYIGKPDKSVLVKLHEAGR